MKIAQLLPLSGSESVSGSNPKSISILPAKGKQSHHVNFYKPIKDGLYYVVPSIRPSLNFSCPLHNSDMVEIFS